MRATAQTAPSLCSVLLCFLGGSRFLWVAFADLAWEGVGRKTKSPCCPLVGSQNRQKEMKLKNQKYFVPDLQKQNDGFNMRARPFSAPSNINGPSTIVVNRPI